MHSFSKNFQNKQLLTYLQQGENPDKVNDNKETPLIIAVKHKNHLGVSILLSYKADPDHPDKFYSTALHWSCIIEECKITDILLKNNANLDLYDINGNTPLDYIIEKKNIKLLNIVKRYLSNSKLRRIITNFLHKKEFLMIKNLVSFRCLKGYECNILNTTLLLDDSYTMFKMLEILEKKLFINCVWLNKLLIKSIKLNKHNCLDIILNYCKDIDLSNSHSGNTLLHIACKNNNIKAVENLIEHGANPLIINKDKILPIHFAAINKNTVLVRLLYRHYFDPNIKDNKNKCFLEYLVDTRDYNLCYLFAKETTICNLYESLMRETLIIYRITVEFHFSNIYKTIQENIFQHWKYVIKSFYNTTGRDFKDVGTVVKSFLFKL
jgi:ankyrin repeat protein